MEGVCSQRVTRIVLTPVPSALRTPPPSPPHTHRAHFFTSSRTHSPPPLPSHFTATMGISDQESTTSQIIFAAVFYSLCSSSMLIVNKFAVRLFPMPSTVATAQLAFCMLVVVGIKYGKLAVVDDIVMEKAKPYMVRRCACLFAPTYYTHWQAVALRSLPAKFAARALPIPQVAALSTRLSPAPPPLPSTYFVPRR